MKIKAKLCNNNIPMNTFFQHVWTSAPKNTQNKSDPDADPCGKSWRYVLLKQVNHFDRIMSQDNIAEMFIEHSCNYGKWSSYTNVNLEPAHMPANECIYPTGIYEVITILSVSFKGWVKSLIYVFLSVSTFHSICQQITDEWYTVLLLSLTQCVWDPCSYPQSCTWKYSLTLTG